MYRQKAWTPEAPRKRKVEWSVVVGVVFLLVGGIGGVVAALFLRTPTFTDDWPSWPPTFRDLNGDGVDDLVGPHGGGALAIDGKTGVVLWGTRFTTEYAESLVVGDFVARLHGREVEILDVRTGQRVRAVTPPWQDKPGHLEACGTDLYATAIDETATRIDPATGAMNDGRPPAGCRTTAPHALVRDGVCRQQHATCTPVPGTDFNARVLGDPATGQSVRISFKEKGTPIATATVLSPAGGTAVVLAPEGSLQAVDLASGWLAAVRGSELVAYQITTKQSWTYPLATGVKTSDYDFGWLRIEKDRVYVDTSPKRHGPRGELVVVELATGTRLWR